MNLTQEHADLIGHGLPIRDVQVEDTNGGAVVRFKPLRPKSPEQSRGFVLLKVECAVEEGVRHVRGMIMSMLDPFCPDCGATEFKDVPLFTSTARVCACCGKEC
jgi:hypothetical protein